MVSHCAQAEYHAIKCGITVGHQASGIFKDIYEYNDKI
jgi:hypothetical protein